MNSRDALIMHICMMLSIHAAGPGLEPGYPGPKPGVLPLDDPANTVLYGKKAPMSMLLPARAEALVATCSGGKFGDARDAGAVDALHQELCHFVARLQCHRLGS